ncbi:MAG: hypothetical protein K1X83_06345 [Oligoflexia bacterium]|nr:hypothetical protein [Oligoflexia bacterium]
MMAAEGPMITGIIGRLPEQKFNLAAFGVAFAWALFLESPVISLLSVSAALCKDRQSFLKLRRFMWILSIGTTLSMVPLLVPAVFNTLAQRLLNLPPQVSTLAYNALWNMVLWPGAIGYRRFYQGAMISHNLPHRVAQGTIVRMLSMAGIGLVLYFFSALPGATIGTAMLVTGVVCEAVATRLMARQVVSKILNQTERKQSAAAELTYHTLFQLYLPLTLTIFLGMTIGPVTTFFLGHSQMAVESLAVLPVSNSVVFFTYTSVIGMQETSIVLAGEGLENTALLKRFAWIIGAALCGVLGLFTFTALGDFWLQKVCGLAPELFWLAKLTLRIGIVMPLLRAWECTQRGLMVKAGRTATVTAASVCELIGIAGVLFACIHRFELIGAPSAQFAVAMGGCAAVGLLIPFTRNATQPAISAAHQ